MYSARGRKDVRGEGRVHGGIWVYTKERALEEGGNGKKTQKRKNNEQMIIDNYFYFFVF